jgi:transposase
LKLEYLPPYSPDLNPIEYSFSVIKKALRAEELNGYENNAEDLLQFAKDVLRIVVEKVTPAIARNQFRHCNIRID